jgi:large subunit ribosomal protein L25
MAEPRIALGKKNGALRREGKVPGVIYGPAHKETIQVQVDRREFERLYLSIWLNKPFSIKIDGHSTRVEIRDVQMNHLGTVPVHVDFYDGARK